MVRMRGSRRRTDWMDTLITQNMSSGTQLLVRLTEAATTAPGHTLTRLLFSMWFSVRTPHGVDGYQSMTMGIGIASEDAFVAPAVPDPDAAGDAPPRGWVMRERVVIQDIVAASRSDPGPLWVQRDLRSQRRLDEGVLYAVFNNNALSGTAFNVEVHGLIRCLALLP